MRRIHITGAGMLLGAPVPKVAAVDARPEAGDAHYWRYVPPPPVARALRPGEYESVAGGHPVRRGPDPEEET